MLKKIPPNETESWHRLSAHYKELKNAHLRDLFAKNPERFKNFSIVFNDILVDYSKNRITEHSLDLLIALAEEVAKSEAGSLKRLPLLLFGLGIVLCVLIALSTLPHACGGFAFLASLVYNVSGLVEFLSWRP